jgi:ABC-type transport system involved in multi-copper enzyme maturation permease subunit
MISPLFSYVLKAAVRDRLAWSIVGVTVIVVALSVFFGATAVIEQDNFVWSFSAFGFRLFGVAALVLFVINFVRRSFEARDVEFLLSRPIGRVSFVLGHAGAFSFIAILCALFLGGAVVALQMGHVNHGVLVWWFSIMIEFIIMANVAMFFSFVMRSATACTMVVSAFYLLARLMGEILGILEKGAAFYQMKVLAYAMEVVSIIVPRLDLMGQTKWIVYPDSAEVSFMFLLTQGAVFLALIISATMVDMKRRQF